MIILKRRLSQNGFETVMTLLAQKSLSPRSFFLLRGYHESRHIQMNYGFKRYLAPLKRI